MKKFLETWKTVPKRPVSTSNQKACLIHIYPTGPGVGSRYPFGDYPLTVGRHDECDICLDDQSVSRRHATVEPEADGFCVVDLQSTNGTFVNDQPVSRKLLEDGDYLRIGSWIFRYLAGGNIEADYHEEIYRLTIIDGLTGIHNKRYLLEFLERELARSARYHRPLGLILFDLDGFKGINDRLGHLGGDHTLRELAIRVREVIRKEELVARYGGDEFAVVLPETSQEEATHMAERLRLLVEQPLFSYEDEPYPVTISLGVVSVQGDAALTPGELIRLADEKLYQAKHAGRNCLRC